jgi:hypothetical protein
MKQLPEVDISKIDPVALKRWQQICGARLLHLMVNIYIRRHPARDDADRELVDAMLAALKALESIMRKSQAPAKGVSQHA